MKLTSEHDRKKGYSRATIEIEVWAPSDPKLRKVYLDSLSELVRRVEYTVETDPSGHEVRALTSQTHRYVIPETRETSVADVSKT